MNHREHRDTENEKDGASNNAPPLVPARAMLPIVVLAIGTILALVLAGVGGDFVHLTTPKKFALSLASGTAVLCVALGSIRRAGCAALAVLHTFLILLFFVVMWYWN